MFSGVYVCIFEPCNFTGEGSEGVKAVFISTRREANVLFFKSMLMAGSGRVNQWSDFSSTRTSQIALIAEKHEDCLATVFVPQAIIIAQQRKRARSKHLKDSKGHNTTCEFSR